MSRCLRDRTLLSLSEGEGTRAHLAHLEACGACAMRYQTLVHDLTVVKQVLRESPPQTVPHRPPVLRAPWMPVAAVLAMAFALVWGGVWMQRSSPIVAPTEARNEAVLLFLEEVSTALFSTVDASAAEIADPAPHGAYVQVALDGEWPCEGPEVFFIPGCDLDPFPPCMEGH